MIDFHVGEETMPSELLDLSGLQRSIDLACAEIDRLRAINAELRAINADLLVALKAMVDWSDPTISHEDWEQILPNAKAAIARAEDR